MQTGIDVGGTFTDVAIWDGRRLRTGKVSTTLDQSLGVVAGVEAVAAGSPPGRLLHGSTIATNTLLEGKGARTVLVATAGFEDVIEVGRQDRPSLYDPMADRPPPLVEGDLRFSTDGRLAPTAEPLAGPDDPAKLAERVVPLAPESVAVSLLYSFVDDRQERAIAAAIAGRLGDVPVSLSSQVAPEFREFERTSTTVLNAYLGPAVSTYLRRLQERVDAAGFSGAISVMRS
ncbi:MAG: hydantoinase/oxoprolinase N-terminal domain-containing protein, partial [Acidimicrobiia bacterium]